MPWLGSIMEQREELIRLYEDGRLNMSDLARHCGISRPTAYKWIRRWCGDEGLEDRSRAPHHALRHVSAEMEAAVLAVRDASGRGAKKLAVALADRFGAEAVPAVSTINDILGRHHRLKPRPKRRRVPRGIEPEGRGKTPNHVWCADHKGCFRTLDGERCDCFTLSDENSRYLLRCRLVDSLDFHCSWPVLESAFREFGLPTALRTDNGVPFATRGIAGLSRLSICLLKLGIRHERIEPGHPEQNGRHERIHLTMEQEALTPRASTRRAQHLRLERWRREYNETRPHEALHMRTPAQVYAPSLKQMPAVVPQFDYPEAKFVRKVDSAGKLYWRHIGVFISEVLTGEHVGLRQFDQNLFELYLGPLKLGILNIKTLEFTRKPDWSTAVEMPG